MSVNKKVLYITYDGMTDPLGQSQVLPYLIGLRPYGYDFTILSFEKKDRFAKLSPVIQKICDENEIRWVPMSFTSKPPLLSKFYDAVRIKRKAIALTRKYGFDMSHCRSYIGADVGMTLKKKFGTKLFFDMRGFWADEKKDGGSWPQSSFIFRQVYQYYKKKEAAYFKHADQIISLTQAGKKEISSWTVYDASVPINVIPCCADTKLFSLTGPDQKQAGRALLGLPADAFILSYLGSVGAWYMLDEMLELFRYIKQRYTGARFLFITHSDPNMVLGRLAAHGLDPADMHIVSAGRQEVAPFVKASDINVSFIQPVYSKLSSSPTKLGEVLVMGIPVISNSGVGDVKQIIEDADAGVVLDTFTDADYRKAVDAIPGLMNKKPADIRSAVEEMYSLETGVGSYLSCYQRVLGK